MGYRKLTFQRYDVTNVVRSQLGVGQRKRLRLWEKNPRCIFCGLYFDHPEDSTLEHLFPAEFGGTYSMSNLALSCRACNGERNTFYQNHFKRRRLRAAPTGPGESNG